MFQPRIIILICMGLFSMINSRSYAQRNSIVFEENITIASKYWKDSVEFNVMIPTTIHRSVDKIAFPLLIIFDSQHANAYPLIKEQVHFLMVDDQIPEFITVGIPFGDEERNPLTSQNKMEGEEMTGQQKTEHLVFEELLPALRERYPISDYIVIAGHSRTAYLTSYLMMERTTEFDAAFAFSGFYSDEMAENIHQYLADRMSERSSPFYYYLSAGTSPIEESYRDHYKDMAQHLDTAELPSLFKWEYIKHPAANHMTNYVISLPDALLRHYEPYNLILYNWILDRTSKVEGEDALRVFQYDLEEAGNIYGTTIYPTPTHINSIASAYFNAGEYETTLLFLDYGLNFHPRDYDMYLFKAYAYEELKDQTGIEKSLEQAKTAFERVKPYLSESKIRAYRAEVEYFSSDR